MWSSPSEKASLPLGSCVIITTVTTVDNNNEMVTTQAQCWHELQNDAPKKKKNSHLIKLIMAVSVNFVCNYYFFNINKLALIVSQMMFSISTGLLICRLFSCWLIKTVPKTLSSTPGICLCGAFPALECLLIYFVHTGTIFPFKGMSLWNVFKGIILLSKNRCYTVSSMC